MTPPTTPPPTPRTLIAASRHVLENGLSGVHNEDVETLRKIETESAGAALAALRAQVEQMWAVRRTGDASLMVRQDRVLEYIDALLLPSEGAGSMSPLRRRPYRDRNLPYTDAIQELADEADGDVHEGHCMVNQEEDPDSCNCALRWFLERAALLSGAAPAAGEE